MIEQLHIVAFTHRNTAVSRIGKLHISPENQGDKLSFVKAALQIKELVFISTCNRVEYQFVSECLWTKVELSHFFETLYPQFTPEEVNIYVDIAEIYVAEDAVRHCLKVASSIDSLVIGEREIITQVRHAHEQARQNGLSGDFLRLLTRHTIETAKTVYTKTRISQKAVSIVSIAFQELQRHNVSKDARVLIIGAGVTNTAMVRFLKDYGLTDFTIYNRSVQKAQILANEVGGNGFSLDKLSEHTNGFDLLVSCTSSENALIDSTLFQKLINGEMTQKIVIDLALPHDIAPQVHEDYQPVSISIESLQQIADLHLKEREAEIFQVNQIINESMPVFRQITRERNVELAMRDVPVSVKQIKDNAINVVFKHEIELMDAQSQETLEKILQFIEKKYVSVPMKMAKEIIIKHHA